MATAPPRVLHVEDNEFFARVAADVLGDEYDFRVRTLGDADAALDLLEAEEFDCIVSDYEMPGMDGLEFLDAVRETYPEVPFILLTGGGSERIASHAISAGVTDYLKKGTGKEQFAVLANRIENAISRRRAERRVDRQVAVNDRIWDVSQAVLQGSSREDIERTVCERLAASDPYLCAWMGTVDREADTVRPQVAAGIDERSLRRVELHSLDDGDRNEVDRKAPSGDDAGERACARPNRDAVREAVGTESVRTRRCESLGAETDLDLDADCCTVAAVPLVYEETTYGVLSLWSGERDAFGETERRVLSKFGNNVAYAIDSVNTRKELVRREQRLQVFNRILRHNLRNDLNVVLGHADNLTEEHPDTEAEADVIKRKASELIEISEKAREVGKTLDHDDRTEKQIDVTDCVTRTCAEFRQSYPNATITVDLPESARVYADKTLEAAISEVVENAIEHNDRDCPSVTVGVSAIESDCEWVEVTVCDDGPGIPEAEREVLAEGEETELHHGSGLGLWLSNWIVGKFGGELAFDDRAEGNAVTLRLQPAEGVGSAPGGF